MLTKVQSFRCNRCGKVFQKDEDEKVSVVSIEDHDVIWDQKDLGEYDFCADCVRRFYDWINHDADHDEFAASKEKVWQKEEV